MFPLLPNLLQEYSPFLAVCKRTFALHMCCSSPISGWTHRLTSLGSAHLLCPHWHHDQQNHFHLSLAAGIYSVASSSPCSRSPTQPPGLDVPWLNTFYSLWTNHTQSLMPLTSSPAITLTLFSSSLISACASSLKGLSTSCNLMVADPIFWLKLVCVGFCYNRDPECIYD